MRLSRASLLFTLLALCLLPGLSLSAQEAPLTIVASHSIAADVIARVASDDAEVLSLIPRGSDPHSFLPTPADLRLLADADLVFVNGANYEEGLLSVINAAVKDESLFVISECVAVIPGGDMHDHGEDDGHDDHEDEDDDHADEDHMDEDDDDHADEDHMDEDDDDHAHEDDMDEDDDHHDAEVDEDVAARCAQHDAELGDRFLRLQDDEASPGPLYAVNCEAINGCDPHFWMQPRNIALWALTVRDILAAHDSAHAEGYFERSQAYLLEIEALEQEELLPLIATLPPEMRLLVSHHFSLGYLATTYGFAELGSVVPGMSGMAEPGVAELAALIDLVRERKLSAIFGEPTAGDDDLMRQVATETGAALVSLDMESLGEEGDPNGTWIGLMRSNVEAIVRSLSGETGG